MSAFGRWTTQHGLPAFHHADPALPWEPAPGQTSTRNVVSLGNRRITLVAGSDGRCGLFDEAHGARFLTSLETGDLLLDGAEAAVRSVTFGPAWMHVVYDGAERTVLCPEGEQPWVLVRVTASRPREIAERWTLKPRFLNLGGGGGTRGADAEAALRYETSVDGAAARAREMRTGAAPDLEGSQPFARVYGPPLPIVVESLAGGTASAPDEDFPTLTATSERATEAWFRVGIDDGSIVGDPRALFESSLRALDERLPRASAPDMPQAAHETRWHAALLTGGACADAVIGGHTLDQASAYSFVMGFNGAARDPLQHAMPLVYSEPDLALSVLRNTCAWATPDGDLPYALDGAKQPWTSIWQPSDQNLWALWLAAEYAAATGDLAAFDAPLPYHPAYAAEAASLREHLRRQFRFFLDEVGTGANGHVRMRNADWNDMAVAYSGVPREDMVRDGESVLNTAMAAWVLPVYAGLCDRLGEAAQAQEARAAGDRLREAVEREWTGRWYRRAYAPGAGALGDDDLWLEVQPWAILCGAATGDRARELLATIDEVARKDSPCGARVRVPPGDHDPGWEGTNGGVWFSINMTLIWAAARVDREMAVDEWRRMSLDAHTNAYPDIWEGTLSGPDAYNAPESERAGRTWGWRMRGGMQAWPVNNLHSHAQPLLSYLRVLGVEPLADGSLAVGASGASFSSRTFSLEADGSGRLTTLGPVVVSTPSGRVSGGPGEVRWG